MEYENIFELNGVCKKYKKFALENITFSLPKGYILGLIGANGAGKSTIIKLLMNLVKRDSGEIKIFGLDNLENEIEIKQRIGFVYGALEFLDIRNKFINFL